MFSNFRDPSCSPDFYEDDREPEYGPCPSCGEVALDDTGWCDVCFEYVEEEE